MWLLFGDRDRKGAKNTNGTRGQDWPRAWFLIRLVSSVTWL